MMGVTTEPVDRAPPSPELVSALNDMKYDALVEAYDLLLSYAMCGKEAAWRGDYGLLGIHTRQARSVMLTIIDIYQQLNANGGEKARAA
jgi:hypothetical protein